MLANFLKKNLNIIFINIKLLTFINFFLISDLYLHIYLKKNSSILKVLKFLKLSSLFNLKVLIDIKCDDILFFSNKYSYKITYIFLNLFRNSRYFLTIFVKKNESILSLKTLYKSASFLEREVWDEFGIHFNNDFEIKRILTDYGFKGHPLKKDFPLTGFYECVFSFEKGRVKQKPISLLQEYRKFSYKNYK